MGRYRKVDPKMWGDEKFLCLSKAKPNAQTLFIFLITGPHTNSAPGLYQVGERALAESLGWSLAEFRKRFDEISRMNMAMADWKNRVILLPNVIKYDPPQNPNIIKKWGKDYDEIPECSLKADYYEIVKIFLEEFPESFQQAFEEHFRKPSLNHSPNDFTNDSMNDCLIPKPIPKPYPKPIPKPLFFEEGFQEFWEAYPKKKSKGQAEKVWNKIEPDEALLEKMLSSIERAKGSVDWRKDDGQFIPFPVTWLNGKRWEDDVGILEDNTKPEPARVQCRDCGGVYKTKEDHQCDSRTFLSGAKG